MPVWKIIPVAPPDDPRWQGRRIWREVLVRAETAAMARVVAGAWERDPNSIGVANETLDFRSGFEDEKLYWVVELDPAAAAGDITGPPEVLRAEPLELDNAAAP